MRPKEDRSFIAFSGPRKIASGSLREVAARAKKHLQENESCQLLIFDDADSAPVEIDFRGTLDTVLRRLDGAGPAEPAKKAGPGRPKLGVVPREVTLLPHHWEWLASQPGGASVTLRKLVEDARKRNAAKDRLRQSQEAAHKFMTAMAGNLPGFEEALRSLYAKDREGFVKWSKPWPKDVREHALKLALPSFPLA